MKFITWLGYVRRLGYLRLVALAAAMLSLCLSEFTAHNADKVNRDMLNALNYQRQTIDHQAYVIQVQAAVITLQRERLQLCGGPHRKEVKF